MASHAIRSIFFVAGLTASCAHQPPPTAAVRAPDPHALVVDAAACWFGPVWFDAAGMPEGERKTATELRCRGLAAQTWGAADTARVEQLRALEAGTVDDLAAHIDALSATRLAADDRRDLVKLVRGLAAAQRENLYARRAADRVKIDLDDDRPHEQLTADEQAAAAPLGAQSAVDALVALDAGRYGADAHALGLLCAMDRMELARGLPKHLKIYAVAGVYQRLFGVAPPELPADPARPIPAGAWLAYLTRVAAGAGLPVADEAAGPRERDLYAWGSVLAGFADRLRPYEDRVAPTLAPIVRGTIRRLQAEYAGTRDRERVQIARERDEALPMSGQKEHAMANCPSAVPGSATRVNNLPDGVEVVIASPDPSAVWEIRERARRQLRAARAHDEGPREHTGAGNGVGDIGHCPIVLVGTTITAEEVPGGVKLTVKAKDRKAAPAVQQATQQRADALAQPRP